MNNHCDFMSHAYKIANIVFGTSYDFTHLPTKTQLLDHHTLDIHIFQPKLPIFFLTLNHAQANTLSKYIKRENYNKKGENYNKKGENYNKKKWLKL